MTDESITTKPAAFRAGILLRTAAAIVCAGIVVLAVWFYRVRSHESEITAEVETARNLMRSRHGAEAAQMLKEIVAAHPDSAEAHLAFGDLLKSSGQWLPAGEQYKECLRIRPEWPPALISLGGVALENGFAHLAADSYRKAVKRLPTNVDAWVGLGRACHLDRKDPEAIHSFETAARLDGSRTDYYSYYAEALSVQLRLPEAEAILRKRLEAEPKDVRSHFVLADTLLLSNPTPERIKEAERELRLVIGYQPDVLFPYTKLAQALLGQRRFPEAIDAATTVLRVQPNNRQALAILTRAYGGIGRLPEAREAQNRLTRATALKKEADHMEATVWQSSDPAAARKLASLLEQTGDTDKARQFLAFAASLEEAARRVSPGSPAPLPTLDPSSASFSTPAR